jgi:perosamine synthetase
MSFAGSKECSQARKTVLSSEFLPFHKPDIGEAEAEAVLDTLRSGWLTTGPKVKRFEADFANYLGCSHAVAVNSGTAALHLALEAVVVSEGDEVIVPVMTFAATAEVVFYLKAKPIFVDCKADTLNLDPERLEGALTQRTKTIIPVHLAGPTCDMNRILEIAKLHNLKVIEDAAHAYYHGLEALIEARFSVTKDASIHQRRCSRPLIRIIGRRRPISGIL